MAESVKALPNEIQAIILAREWDMRTREGIKRFTELRAKSLPTIALNDELVYEAIIPPQEELIEQIKIRHCGKG